MTSAVRSPDPSKSLRRISNQRGSVSGGLSQIARDDVGPPTRPYAPHPRLRPALHIHRSVVHAGLRACGLVDSIFIARTGIDYESYLTARSLGRKPSPIRALQPLLSIPGMISLGGGMPNPATFPFASVDVTLKSGEKLPITDADFK